MKCISSIATSLRDYGNATSQDLKLVTVTLAAAPNQLDDRHAQDLAQRSCDVALEASHGRLRARNTQTPCYVVELIYSASFFAASHC